MLKKYKNNIMAISLTVVMLITSLAVTSFSETKEIAQTEDICDEIYTTVYEALDYEEMQECLNAEYTSINAEVDGEDIEIEVTNWTSTDYADEKAGEYYFSPTIDASYELAEDVSLPQIRVIIETNTILEIYTEFASLYSSLDDLPAEIEVLLSLQTSEDIENAEMSEALESDGVDLNENEASEEEETEVQATIDIGWECSSYSEGDTGAFIFTAAVDEDRYEFEASLDIPSVTVVIGEDESVNEDNVASASLEEGVAAASEGANSYSGVVSIDEFSAELVTGATLNSSGDYVWTPSSSSSGHKFKFRVNFAVSTQDTIAIGDIVIKIPASILNDKDGNSADTVYMSYPSSSDIEGLSESALAQLDGFAWYEEDGHIIVYNFVEFSSAVEGYFEVSYETSKKTYYYTDYGADGDVSDIFSASIEIGSDLSDESDEYVVYIDTYSKVSSATKYSPTRYTSWQSSWGDEPDGEYSYYLLWEIKTVFSSSNTQSYDFTLTDNTITYSLTNSDGSTASGSISDGGVSIVAYKLSGSSWTSNSGTLSVTVSDLTSTSTRYDYIIVALDADTFSDATSITVKNTATSTVTPADGVDSATSKSASSTYSWTKPVWTTPSGSFNVYKYGDEYYESLYNKDYYTSYDLNSLQEDEATELSGIDYRIYMVGYAFPWTLMDDWSSNSDYYTTSSSGTIIPSYKAYGHNSVTYTMTDDTVYPLYSDGTDINGNDLSNATGTESLDEYGSLSSYSDTDPLESDDYDFDYITYSITFKDAERDDNGDPTVDEDTLEYNVSTKSATSSDVLSIYVKVSGTWYLACEYNLYSKTVTSEGDGYDYISSISSSKIAFKEGVDGYKLEVSNAYYYTYINVYAYITLYPTENVQAWAGTESNGTEETEVLLRNTVVMNVYYADEYEEDGEDADSIVSIGKANGDRLRRAEKASSLTKTVSAKSNSTANKKYTVTWKIYLKETVTYGSGSTSYIEQEGGTFYDLLPYGSTYEEDSVLIKTESGYLSESSYEVSVTDNYNDSGRTLLVVTIKDSFSYAYLYFNNIFTWNSLSDVGYDVINPVAYETGNSSITDGYADTAETLSSENAAYMASLSGATAAKYLYDEEEVDIVTETASTTGLTKQIKSESEDEYSDTAYLTLEETYSYQIRYANSYTATSSDIVIYDALECFDDGDWKGTLASVDTTQLALMGISPVIYISTVEDLDFSNEDSTDLTNTSIWSVANGDYSSARAIAIDLSTATDGSDFVLGNGESVVVTLYMQGPSSASADGISYPVAYNNVYVSFTDKTDTENTIHYNYTTAYVCVVGDVYLEKVNEQDTSEVISGISFRLYGTSDYGTEIDMTKTTDVNGQIKFSDIEKGTYILQETGDYDDWIADHTELTVIIDESGNVTIKGLSNSADSYYVFENEPRIHADIEFYKIDELDSSYIGTGFTFKLTGTSYYGTQVTEYASSSSSSKVIFSNIERGTYTLTEIEADGNYILSTAAYTVIVDENGNVNILDDTDTVVGTTKAGVFTITNHPYQMLTILKRSSYDNAAVEGVEFTLKGTSDLGTYYESSQTSNSNGQITFEDLEPGTYTLSETSIDNATTEVVLDDTVRVVVVADDGTITVDGEELNQYHNYVITNTEVTTGTVSVIKKWVVDDTSELYDENGTPIFPTIYLTTDAPVVYVDLTFDLGSSDASLTFTYNGTEYTSSNGSLTVSVASGSTLADILEDADPSYSGYSFNGWYSDNETSSAFATSTQITTGMTIYAGWEELTVKYAVSVYGIEEDVYSDDDGETTETSGLTFGPATGYSYVSQYAFHTPSGNTEEGAKDTASATIDGEVVSTTEGEVSAHRCIHDDSWEMIIWWSEHNPYVYEQCITGGTNSSDETTGVSCTKAIEITLNDTLANSTYVTDDTTSSHYSYTHMSGDGCGTLYYVLNSNYRMWNGYDSSRSYYSYGGWGSSQIRQVLNGEDTAGYSTTYSSCWHNSSGTEFTEIDEDTSLLSCFPEELQEAIASTQITYNQHTGTSSSTQDAATCYDKLFLMSTYDVWAYSVSYEPDTAQYSRNVALGITTSNYTLAKQYAENGSACYSWLRSVYYSNSFIAPHVSSSGNYGNSYVIVASLGVAPCFSLK